MSSRQSVNGYCDRLEATHVIVKAIRLRADVLLEWLLQSESKAQRVKVVHLVRDPRARFNSMLKVTSVWLTLEL